MRADRQERRQGPVAQVAPVKTVRILVAEDNRVNQALALGLLEKEGFGVVIAANGSEAVEALSREHFDLVLMDVQMPVMNGLDATRAIRDIEKITGKHIPIIALTAAAMKNDQDDCFAAGMDSYLSKPIRGTELFAAINAFCAPVDGRPSAVQLTG